MVVYDYIAGEPYVPTKVKLHDPAGEGAKSLYPVTVLGAIVAGLDTEDALATNIANQSNQIKYKYLEPFYQVGNQGKLYNDYLNITFTAGTNKIDSSSLNIFNGEGKIMSDLLPSFVDDVVEVPVLGGTEYPDANLFIRVGENDQGVTTYTFYTKGANNNWVIGGGETGKIYIAATTGGVGDGSIYRCVTGSTSTAIKISENPYAIDQTVTNGVSLSTDNGNLKAVAVSATYGRLGTVRISNAATNNVALTCTDGVVAVSAGVGAPTLPGVVYAVGAQTEIDFIAQNMGSGALAYTVPTADYMQAYVTSVVAGVNFATSNTPGIVQIGSNIDVGSSGLISVNSAASNRWGVIRIVDTIADTAAGNTGNIDKAVTLGGISSYIDRKVAHYQPVLLEGPGIDITTTNNGDVISVSPEAPLTFTNEVLAGNQKLTISDATTGARGVVVLAGAPSDIAQAYTSDGNGHPYAVTPAAVSAYVSSAIVSSAGVPVPTESVRGGIRVSSANTGLDLIGSPQDVLRIKREAPLYINDANNLTISSATLNGSGAVNVVSTAAQIDVEDYAEYVPQNRAIIEYLAGQTFGSTYHFTSGTTELEGGTVTAVVDSTTYGWMRLAAAGIGVAAATQGSSGVAALETTVEGIEGATTTNATWVPTVSAISKYLSSHYQSSGTYQSAINFSSGVVKVTVAGGNDLVTAVVNSTAYPWMRLDASSGIGVVAATQGSSGAVALQTSANGIKTLTAANSNYVPTAEAVSAYVDLKTPAYVSGVSCDINTTTGSSSILAKIDTATYPWMRLGSNGLGVIYATSGSSGVVALETNGSAISAVTTANSARVPTIKAISSYLVDAYQSKGDYQSAGDYQPAGNYESSLTFASGLSRIVAETAAGNDKIVASADPSASWTYVTSAGIGVSSAGSSAYGVVALETRVAGLSTVTSVNSNYVPSVNALHEYLASYYQASGDYQSSAVFTSGITSANNTITAVVQGGHMILNSNGIGVSSAGSSSYGVVALEPRSLGIANITSVNSEYTPTVEAVNGYVALKTPTYTSGVSVIVNSETLTSTVVASADPAASCVYVSATGIGVSSATASKHGVVKIVETSAAIVSSANSGSVPTASALMAYVAGEIGNLPISGSDPIYVNNGTIGLYYTAPLELNGTNLTVSRATTAAPGVVTYLTSNVWDKPTPSTSALVLHPLAAASAIVEMTDWATAGEGITLTSGSVTVTLVEGTTADYQYNLTKAAIDLDVATDSTLGGVIVGSGLGIGASGTARYGYLDLQPATDDSLGGVYTVLTSAELEGDGDPTHVPTASAVNEFVTSKIAAAGAQGALTTGAGIYIGSSGTVASNFISAVVKAPLISSGSAIALDITLPLTVSNNKLDIKDASTAARGVVKYASVGAFAAVYPANSAVVMHPMAVASTVVKATDWLDDGEGLTLTSGTFTGVAQDGTSYTYTKASITLDAATYNTIGGVKIVSTGAQVSATTNSARVPTNSAIKDYVSTYIGEQAFQSALTPGSGIDISGNVISARLSSDAVSKGGLYFSEGEIALESAGYVDTSDGSAFNNTFVPLGGIRVRSGHGLLINSGVVDLAVTDQDSLGGVMVPHSATASGLQVDGSGHLKLNSATTDYLGGIKLKGSQTGLTMGQDAVLSAATLLPVYVDANNQIAVHTASNSTSVGVVGVLSNTAEITAGSGTAHAVPNAAGLIDYVSTKVPGTLDGTGLYWSGGQLNVSGVYPIVVDAASDAVTVHTAVAEHGTTLTSGALGVVYVRDVIRDSATITAGTLEANTVPNEKAVRTLVDNTSSAIINTIDNRMYITYTAV